MSVIPLKRLHLLEGLLLVFVIVTIFLFAKPLFFKKSRPPFRIFGLLEAEDLEIKGKSSNVSLQKQDTHEFFGGKWSKDFHLFGMAYGVGEWVEFVIPISTAGKYKWYAFLTRSYDYGIVRFLLDQKPLGEPIDLWSPNGNIADTGKLLLSAVELSATPHILRIEVVGKNPNDNSGHYFFGIDGFLLEKI